jgi:hypothetical protein
MTSTARQPVSLVLDGAPAWAVSVSWELSAKAGLGLAERVGGGGERVVVVEFALEPSGARCGRAVLWAVLGSGERVELRRESGVKALWRREAAYEHADAPGVLSYTARRGPPASVTFVRCPWLAACGVPAGSYSVRGG